MAAATTTEQTSESRSAPVPFDFSQPPVIEGFNPLPKVKDETFKDKFIRKTKENPFVPIGELHKQGAKFVFLMSSDAYLYITHQTRGVREIITR